MGKKGVRRGEKIIVTRGVGKFRFRDNKSKIKMTLTELKKKRIIDIVKFNRSKP